MIKGRHKIPRPGLPLNFIDRIKQSEHGASLAPLPLSLAPSLSLYVQFSINRFGPFVIQFRSHCHMLWLYKIPSWLKGNPSLSEIQTM
jgi:hypothetical protein